MHLKENSRDEFWIKVYENELRLFPKIMLEFITLFHIRKLINIPNDEVSDQKTVSI